MKYLKTKGYYFIPFICFILGLFSCQKNSDAGPSTAKFLASTATYAEDKGLVNIDITLSSAQAQDVTVQYTWSGAAGTYLDGDFKFGIPGSIVIKAGETTGSIQLQIIDDTQIDADDVVTLTLSGTSSNAKPSAVATENAFAQRSPTMMLHPPTNFRLTSFGEPARPASMWSIWICLPSRV